MITPPDSTPAATMADQINAAFADANATAARASSLAATAIQRGLECGALLNRQKSIVGHGRWQSWLVANCPAIAPSTARKYMRLAKLAAAGLLPEALAFRQGCIATGVLPASPRRLPNPEEKYPCVSYTRGLDLFRRWYHRRIDEVPVEDWTPEARRVLRMELGWFKRLDDKLAGIDPSPSRPPTGNRPVSPRLGRLCSGGGRRSRATHPGTPGIGGMD
jgi:hypothetical protein